MSVNVVEIANAPVVANARVAARRAIPRRQVVRRALLLMSFLLFPITLNYFSPYAIIEGAGQGIVSGSFVVFGLMFLSSLFVGRLWCGWGCPVGGLQDWGATVNDRPARGGRRDLIKWAIWVPWVALIAQAAAMAGGLYTVNPFYLTENGISVDQPVRYIMYYTVVISVVALSFFASKRAGCHYVCWMAPFMIAGRKVRNAFGWPSLRLVADTGKCSSCGTCSRACPMSLKVEEMVRKGSMENAECILCGTCVDGCPKKTLRYSFSAGK